MTGLLPDLDFAQEKSAEIPRQLEVDEQGRLVIPPGLAARLGLKPGEKAPIELVGDTLRVRRPLNSLAKVYIEPTSRCNLACRTCMRNAWDEPLGIMTEGTFQAILEGLQRFDPVPAIFFGGFGEPLAHPHIGEMVSQAKQTGALVELITNGILLDESHCRQLIETGLDRLWVSLDGATPESYTDVRLAAALPQILKNLAHFQEISLARTGRMTELGVAFVAMKRNIADLPRLVHMSHQIGATRYLVTNVLPYTQDNCTETLYNLSINRLPDAVNSFSPQIDLPRIDWNPATQLPLYYLLRTYGNVSMGEGLLDRSANRCPFITRGSTAIAWDGLVSPCLALMHPYSSYLDDRERHSLRYTLGNVRERDLDQIWNDPEYVNFRQRLEAFEFSPCTLCGGCDMAERNEEDCFGNTFPTCGGCLWAQGVVQCP